MSVVLGKSGNDVVRTALVPSQALWVIGMVSVVLALPPVIYAYLSHHQFRLFNPTYFIPYEELLDAIRSGDPVSVLSAPVISVNMTSGLLLSNMYSLDIEQLLLSVGLGVVMGLTLDAQLSLRKVCALNSVGGSAAAAGTGLVATLAASSTGILGCCGSALFGGIFVLAGVSSVTASQLAEVSPFIQLALIAVFALAYLRFSKRLKTMTKSV